MASIEYQKWTLGGVASGTSFTPGDTFNSTVRFQCKIKLGCTSTNTTAYFNLLVEAYELNGTRYWTNTYQSNIIQIGEDGAGNTYVSFTIPAEVNKGELRFTYSSPTVNDSDFTNFVANIEGEGIGVSANIVLNTSFARPGDTILCTGYYGNKDTAVTKDYIGAILVLYGGGQVLKEVRGYQPDVYPGTLHAIHTNYTLPVDTTLPQITAYLFTYHWEGDTPPINPPTEWYIPVDLY